jgi:hypothetical protein
MPTVLRKDGFNFKINTDDHAPAHVHVWYQGKMLIVEFEDEIVTRNNYGFNRREEREALKIVGENQILFQIEWDKIYGQS